MSDIHLVVFCSAAYRKPFLDHCVYCISKNVQDNIVSKTIISNDNFKYPGFDVITDREFWKIIDPWFERKKLFQQNWIRQQIIKLSLGEILSGDILVVDADLFFLRPVKFIENGVYNIYTAYEYFPRYFHMIGWLTGIRKQANRSFITDFAVFNTAILNEILCLIKARHNRCWLETIEMLPNSGDIKNVGDAVSTGPVLSEFELYGNYLCFKHKDKINKIISPVDYKMWLPINKINLDVTSSVFLENMLAQNKNYYQCIDGRSFIAGD